MVICKKYNSTHSKATCITRIKNFKKAKNRNSKHWAALNQNTYRYEGCINCETGNKLLIEK